MRFITVFTVLPASLLSGANRSLLVENGRKMPIRFLGGTKNFVAFWNRVDRWMTHLKAATSSDRNII